MSKKSEELLSQIAQKRDGNWIVNLPVPESVTLENISLGEVCELSEEIARTLDEIGLSYSYMNHQNGKLVIHGLFPQAC